MRFNRNDLADNKVFENVRKYLARELPNYELMTVIHSSDHKADNYLYEVEAKNKHNGLFTVWTCWNELMQALNHGHYDLDGESACEKVMAECHWPPRFEIGDCVDIYTVRKEGRGVITDKGDEDGFWEVLTLDGEYDTFGASELELL